MERLSGDMTALDKIKKLTEQIESWNEEDIKKFKKDFEEFEKEYETMWLSSEEFSDVSIELSEPKLCQVNEDGEWEECKDGKISLRKLATVARQKDGRPPIEEPIETSIDHLPIDRLVKEITEKAISRAKNGQTETYIDIYYLDNQYLLYRQVHELLNVLYKRLEDMFEDTMSLHVSWEYDYDKEDTFMILNIEW